MPKIPLYLPQQSPNTGATGSSASPNDVIGGKDSLLVGRSVSDAAGSLAQLGMSQQNQEERIRSATLRQQNIISNLIEQKTHQVELLQVNQKTSQLRADWNKRLLDYQQNPPENLLDTGATEYDTYVEKLLKDSPTPNVRNQMALNASEFRIQYVNELFKLQSQVQLGQFGAAFDSMMTNAEDSIFITNSIAELMYQKSLLNKTIDDAVSTGQIRDKQIVQSLRDKTNLLAISWVEATMAENPALAKQVVNMEKPFEDVMKGVGVHHRQVLLQKIDEVEKTHDNQEKMLLRQSFESDKIQRIQTGQGGALNLDRFEDVFGKVARESAERELNNASKLYSYNSRLIGASGDEMDKVLSDATPKSDPTSTTYHEEQELYQNVQKLYSHAMDDKKNDAFTFFAQNPAVRSLAQKAVEYPTPENHKVLQHAVLDLQKEDNSLFPFEYKIMPQEKADDWIQQFNKLIEVGSKESGAGVRDLLISFNDQYSEDTTIALNQLSETKGGDKVTAKINPLMWHLENPSTFRLIVDAIRKDPTEVYQRFKTEKEKNNFLDEVSLDQNLLMYQSSILSADNSSKASSLVSGVRDTFRDFARDYVLNGGKQEDASQMFFSNYTWGELNGASYARPRAYSDNTGKRHVMSDDQVRLSNLYLEFYPRTIDPGTIAPETILNETKFFSSKQLTNDVKSALRSSVFWATTEDETGVYLYTKGSMMGTSRQVFTTDGNPVRINFVDSMKSIPKVDFGTKTLPGKAVENTGDTAFERLMKALSTLD